ncbi:hypothetical protein TWF730_003659 [Orbilia blumenaviensis]|uniref:NACHT domain-containing protein n=1 Tax=Orbilia blumenaviensis TaxID=1796055 RepID=A0AAV9U2S2_9PEZI
MWSLYQIVCFILNAIINEFLFQIGRTIRAPAPHERLDESSQLPQQVEVQDASQVSQKIEVEDASLFSNDDYQIGWISALPLELAAAKGMLDEEHGNPQTLPRKGDNNTYVLGRIKQHNIVIACLPKGEIGASSAALVANDMLASFPNIRIGLMVGIGAGIPDCDENENDIHLGDVVISSDKKTGGVFAYNFGKRLADGSFEVAYHLNQPPRVLRTALANLEARHESQDNLIPKYIKEMLEKFSENKRAQWTYPGSNMDVLFSADYLHQGGKTCKDCDPGKTIRRNSQSRTGSTPVVHYGIIATGSEVVKHALTRNQIRKDHNAICLEMEAAGLMNNFPCIVIRGISDYADSHKNDQWHRYAAASAAACAKELLDFVHPLEVQNNPKAAEVLGHLRFIERKINEVSTGMTRLQLEAQNEKIKKWLSPPDPETNLMQALEAHYEGTGSWFLHGKQFETWKSGDNCKLWIRGIPGTGKTILSAKIIHSLFLEQKSDDQTYTLYFFFDTRDSEKQTLKSLLQSLIFQLYRVCDKSKVFLNAVFSEKYESRARLPSVEDLVKIFLNMMRSARQNIKIILDALDESSTQDALLDFTRSLSQKFEKISFLVTSRDESLIEMQMRDWLNERDFVTIEKDIVNIDIIAYTKYVLKEDRGFKRWSKFPDSILKMEKKILENADGMFRLAACQLDVLKTCVDLGQVEDELKRLPTTLKGVYERILQNIGDQHHSRVVRILQFLVYSRRPLQIEELIDAAAVDLSRQPAFESERRMPDPQGILEICPSLLTRALRVDEKDNNNIIVTIELAHATVKEFLRSLEQTNIFYEIADSSKAQGVIAMVCLAYLTYLSEGKPRDVIRANFPLALFSSRYWLEYASNSDQSPTVSEAAIRFLSSETTRELWGALYNPDRPWEELPAEFSMASPLYYASLAGLTHTIAILLRSGADTAAPGGEYGYPLQAASVGGHWEAVKLLLDHGSRLEAIGGLLGHALQAASMRGNEKVVSLLLEKGADIDAQGGKYGNALQAASARGHDQAVRLLLAGGADPNARGGKYTNALYAASLRGYPQVVRLLIEGGVKCNTKDGRYGSALQAAAVGGHVEIVMLLLQNRADVNKRCGIYGSALQAASVRGYGRIARLLLENKADVNVQGGLFHTSLQAASARRDKHLVELLLANGANPNCPGGYYGNALQAASAQGHAGIVALLIAAGADVNARIGDSWSWNLRHINSRGGSASSAEFENMLMKSATESDLNLAQHGLNKSISLQEEDFKNYSDLVSGLLTEPRKRVIRENLPEIDPTPLSGYETEEETLLRKLKGKTLRDKFNDTALQAASTQGHNEVVRVLLEAGAKPNTPCEFYGTALQAASAQGQELVVKLLLQYGADPNIRGGFYGTALGAASARGHHTIVGLLLSQGADSTASQGILKGPLYSASFQGYSVIIQQLLENMPYASIMDKSRQSAL